MRAITGAITLDREFLQAAVTLGEQILSERPLPLAVNGLSGGAQDAFVTELARKAAEFTGQGGVVFVNDEKLTDATFSVTEEMLKEGVKIRKGKKVFHKAILA